MALCGIREGMDNVSLEINSFNWSENKFCVCAIIKEMKGSFAYHLTEGAER